MTKAGRWVLGLGVTFALHGTVGAMIWTLNTPLRPVLECVVAHGDEHFTAHFGYTNRDEQPVERPIGPDNRFRGVDPDQGQPTHFEPGRSASFPRSIVKVDFDGREIRWELDHGTAVASRESDRCEPPKQQPELVPVLPKPKPKPKPKPEPEKIEPPKVEEKKEPPKLDKPKEDVPPQKRQRRKGQPKRKKRPPKKEVEAPKPDEPIPLVLSNVNLTGGVAVQKGEEDIFGDPEVEADQRNTNLDAVEDAPAGTRDVAVEVAPKRPPKIVMPRPISNFDDWPYPEDAPRLGRAVVVKLSLVVGPDGRVKAVRVVKPGGGVFDRDAKRLAKKLRFRPATRDGEPVEMRIPWTVTFEPSD